MSEYKLDDDLVAQLLNNPDRLPRALFAALSAQLPIPVPVKVGAVVKTEMPVRGPRFFIRWAWDVSTTEPWIEHGDHDLSTYRTDQIGRITEVLSPGVDL